MMTRQAEPERRVYDARRTAEAWRLFVSTGEVDAGAIRPEIERSWKRCRLAGVNPWSVAFPSMDENLLREKRALFAHSLEVNQPIMHMLLALLQCNVSLMDQENFIFDFFSPLSYYPRTLGTYVQEDEVGTGNATLVAYERKPVRVEGFEHYRSVSQGYSGVSAPFLDVQGAYFGALNLNDPFGTLPECALDMCTRGVSMANELFLMRKEMWVRLRSLEFFRPLLEMMDAPVLIVDPHGRVLESNSSMMRFLPGVEDYGYGEQSLDAYLAGDTTMKQVLSGPFEDGHPMPVRFRGRHRGDARVLNCLHRNTIQLKNGMRFIVLVFDGEKRRESGEASMAKDVAAPLKHESRAVDYVGDSDEWRHVDEMVSRIAPIKANALILGETGTGKELVARAIHRRSARPGNFVAINCGAIPHDLFAAELFGYESGAFTGAREGGSLGKIEAADHGTILLDEIGEMPLDLQVGLLRVIQEQAVTRLGSNEPRTLDVRFLAATNQDLAALVDAQAFRADLYFRLSAMELHLPALRKRKGDIPLLVEYFNDLISESLGLPRSPFSDGIKETLSRYSWPGNVRELRNVVERSLILAGEGSKVDASDLPVHIANAQSMGKKFFPASVLRFESERPTALRDCGGPSSPARESEWDDRGGRRPLGAVLTDAEEIERNRIRDALIEYDGNLSRSAAALGVSRTTLYKRMAHFRMHVRIAVEFED